MNISNRATTVRVPALVIPRLFSYLRLARSVSAVVMKAMIGSGTASPRGYRREGFPDCELHQVISGKKDRFEGL